MKIVSYDWLTASLMSASRAPRAAKEFLWENILQNEKNARAEKSQGKKGRASQSQKAEEENAKTAQRKRDRKAKGKKADSKTLKARRRKRVPGNVLDLKLLPMVLYIAHKHCA